MNNPESTPILVTTLSSFGEVVIVDDKLLTFKQEDKEPVMLRYSVGETFSFLKGGDPIKIQLREGFEPDMGKFKAKLAEVVSSEIENGFPVRFAYEEEVALLAIKSKLDPNFNVILRPKNLSIEEDLFTIEICGNEMVGFKLKAGITKLDSIDKLEDVLSNIKKEIANVESHLN